MFCLTGFDLFHVLVSAYPVVIAYTLTKRFSGGACLLVSHPTCLPATWLRRESPCVDCVVSTKEVMRVTQVATLSFPSAHGRQDMP